MGISVGPESVVYGRGHTHTDEITLVDITTLNGLEINSTGSKEVPRIEENDCLYIKVKLLSDWRGR